MRAAVSPDAALFGAIVDHLGHRGAVCGTAVVSQAIAAIGEDRDLVPAFSAGDLF